MPPIPSYYITKSKLLIRIQANKKYYFLFDILKVCIKLQRKHDYRNAFESTWVEPYVSSPKEKVIVLRSPTKTAQRFYSHHKSDNG